MSGNPEDVPDHFIGKIDVDYVLGGRFSDEACPNCEVQLESHNELKRKYTSNVLGFIRGDVEPDRYVILGNHRDAWGFGAVDPNSGTAQVTFIKQFKYIFYYIIIFVIIYLMLMLLIIFVIIYLMLMLFIIFVIY